MTNDTETARPDRATFGTEEELGAADAIRACLADLDFGAYIRDVVARIESGGGAMTSSLDYQDAYQRCSEALHHLEAKNVELRAEVERLTALIGKDVKVIVPPVPESEVIAAEILARIAAALKDEGT